MANTPLGYYKWFPRDFYSSVTVRGMSFTARAIYRELLDIQWESERLPNAKQLPSILQVTLEQWNEFAEHLDVLFPDGQNERLKSLRDEAVERSAKAAKSGSKGGKCKRTPSKRLPKAKRTSSQTETETETETKNKTGKKGLATWHEFAEMELPPSLNSVAGRDAWNKFCKHRSEKGAKLTSTNADALLKKLGRYPAMVAVGCLLQTIENGWQGIFPDKYNPPSSTQSTPKSSTPVHGVDFINVELPNGDVAEFKPGFTADDESNPDAWFDRAKWGQA